MAFTYLVITDFDARITAAERAAITDSDDTILERVEIEVIEEVKALANRRYDMDAEFSKTGSARSGLLIRYVVDIIIYEVMSRNKPRQLPEIRVTRAEDARDFIAASGNPRSNTAPAWAPLTEPIDLDPLTGKSTRSVSWGSQEKLDLNY